jgi:uncharacterized protein YcfL
MLLDTRLRMGSIALMKCLLLPLAVVLIAGCASSTDPLVVKQYVLRDQERSQSDEPMVRMEKSRRLHGAVSMEERGQRLGQYYTVLWSDPAGAGEGDVEVVFQYQQGGTGSRVKVMTKSFPPEAKRGVADFAVTGDEYFKNGKVLTWKASVSRGGREIAARQSYLWR